MIILVTPTAEALKALSDTDDRVHETLTLKSADAGTKGPPKVLVVDDEIIIADTLAEILNQHGFDASTAYSCDEALGKAKTSPPDVVISDVIMPGKTGVDLGIAVRSIFPSARVILLSGQAATSSLLDRARDHGYEFELLAKPLHPSVLLELLDFEG